MPTRTGAVSYTHLDVYKRQVTVYVGHVGWKSLGAGIGYTVASGVTMFLVTLFGLGSFLLALIPIAAIVPILVYIGIVTANQVVRESPKNEVPVIVVALFPWVANWALTIVNNVISAAGTSVATLGTKTLAAKGVSVSYTHLDVYKRQPQHCIAVSTDSNNFAHH